MAMATSFGLTRHHLVDAWALLATLVVEGKDVNVELDWNELSRQPEDEFIMHECLRGDCRGQQ